MLIETLASLDAEKREYWYKLWLAAFAANSIEDEAVTRLFIDLRALPFDQQQAFGIPRLANDISLYQYVMREGGKLLLALEKP